MAKFYKNLLSHHINSQIISRSSILAVGILSALTKFLAHAAEALIQCMSLICQLILSLGRDRISPKIPPFPPRVCVLCLLADVVIFGFIWTQRIYLDIYLDYHWTHKNYIWIHLDIYLDYHWTHKDYIWIYLDTYLDTKIISGFIWTHIWTQRLYLDSSGQISGHISKQISGFIWTQRIYLDLSGHISGHKDNIWTYIWIITDRPGQHTGRGRT